MAKDSGKALFVLAYRQYSGEHDDIACMGEVELAHSG